MDATDDVSSDANTISESVADDTNRIESPSSETDAEIQPSLDQSDDSKLSGSARFDFDDASTVDITPEKSGGVLKKVLKEGEGEEFPGLGDRVSVHYTGWLLGKEATVFDSNIKEEKFEFNLGRGMVIKGWDLGIGTMKKNEVALFICHPKYAYGDMGYPPTIPPFTPLLFEIKLFGWKLEDLSPKRDESILRKILEKGEDNTFPNEGSQLKVEIIERMKEEEVGREVKEFVLGEGFMWGVPEGLETALYKFCLKEKSVVYLRNKYTEDVRRSCGADDDALAEVKYEVSLLHLQKAKNIWEMNTDEKFEKAKLSKEKGITFYKMGEYKVALKQFRWIVTCLENEPGACEETAESRRLLLLSGWLNLALCHRKMGNPSEVVKATTKALALDPRNEKALFRRAQARIETNECEEALRDFESVCSLNPDNKAAQNLIVVCQNKLKEQRLKDKSTYNKMFDLFVKQDEERLKNMKTETGVWDEEQKEEEQRLREDSIPLNEALLDAHVIELSNTANGNLSYPM